MAKIDIRRDLKTILKKLDTCEKLIDEIAVEPTAPVSISHSENTENPLSIMQKYLKLLIAKTENVKTVKTILEDIGETQNKENINFALNIIKKPEYDVKQADFAKKILNEYEGKISEFPSLAEVSKLLNAFLEANGKTSDKDSDIILSSDKIVNLEFNSERLTCTSEADANCFIDLCNKLSKSGFNVVSSEVNGNGLNVQINRKLIKIFNYAFDNADYSSPIDKEVAKALSLIVELSKEMIIQRFTESDYITFLDTSKSFIEKSDFKDEIKRVLNGIVLNDKKNTSQRKIEGRAIDQLRLLLTTLAVSRSVFTKGTFDKISLILTEVIAKDISFLNLSRRSKYLLLSIINSSLLDYRTIMGHIYNSKNIDKDSLGKITEDLALNGFTFDKKINHSEELLTTNNSSLEKTVLIRETHKDYATYNELKTPLTEKEQLSIGSRLRDLAYAYDLDKSNPEIVKRIMDDIDKKIKTIKTKLSASKFENNDESGKIVNSTIRVISLAKSANALLKKLDSEEETE